MYSLVANFSEYQRANNSSTGLAGRLVSAVADGHISAVAAAPDDTPQHLSRTREPVH